MKTIFFYLIITISFLASETTSIAQCDVIYASPTGVAINDGTEAYPVDIQTALNQACLLNKQHIRLLAGTYNITSKLVIGCDDIIIDGNWEVISGIGRKNSSLITTVNINSPLENVNYDGALGTIVGVYIGVEAIGVNNFRIEDITFNVKNGGASGNVAGTTGNRGRSVYGFYFSTTNGWTIERCSMNTGAGSDGADGTNGVNGLNGSNGGNGSLADCDDDCQTNFGGQGGNGGGGTLGAPQNNDGSCRNTGQNGANGISAGAIRNGGGGGAGGSAGAENNRGGNGGNGGNGGGGAIGGSTGGGFGNGHSGTGSGTCSVVNGKDGGIGSIPSNGTNGVVLPISVTYSNYWLPSGQSSAGTDGHGGSGGKGGGGGGGQGCFFCTDGTGGGGGGGGGGGQGGQGASGGWGGGGSFALYQIGGLGTLSNTTLNLAPIASGGNGGTGGVGGDGGIGGVTAGLIGGCTTCEVGIGGKGGDGRKGGDGGNGGNGASGVSSAIQYVSGANSTINTSPAISQVITNTPLEGCSNSEILITKDGGTWGITGTGSYINDLNSTTSTYNNTSSSALISYSSVGPQSIDINGDSYNGFIIINTARPLPVFDPTMSNTICEGNSFTMSTSTIGTQYEWVIFDATGSTTTPIATYNNSIASWSTPVIGTSLNYTVRLRVKNDCCGWSIPVYFDFSVISVGTGPIATGATICEGQTANISASGSGLGNLTWYSDALGQIVLQSTAGATSNYTTPIINQNTVFYVGESIGSCSSNLTSVQVITTSLPNSPSVSPIEVCEGSDVIISGTGSGTGDLVFYDNTMTELGRVTMGGTPTVSYNAGALTAGSYTFYVTEDNGTCESTPTVVSAMVNALPSAPTASGATICAGSSTTLNASSTGTIHWYSDAGLTNLLNTGSTYTTGNLTVNTDYYITQTNTTTGCESAATTVSVTTNPLPADPTGTGTTICSGQTATISATNSGGTTNWYSDASATNLIGSSTTFSTPVLTQNTTYYVQEVSASSCLSNIIAVNVNVNTIPSTPSVSSVTVCEGSDVIISGTGSGTGDLVFYDNTMTELGRVTMGGTPTVSYNAGALAAGTYTFYVTEDNGTCESTETATSVVVDAPTGAASVTISASASSICAGSSVTFTANTTNGGNNTTYQWYVNGSTVGGNSNVFVSSTLVDADDITLDITSNTYCLANANATSNTISMTVSPNVNPTISITSSATNICSGTNVTFTATSSNGGTTPVYDWLINGVSQATNANTFTSSTLSDGDIVTASLVSNAPCATPSSVNSNAITISVSNSVTPSVTIGASNTTICQGSSVTFTASQSNGGINPSYQWYVNGNPAGTNNSTFTSSSIVDGDVVSLTMTSSETCVTSSTASSNTINMSVNSTVTPTVSITTSSTTICSGTNVTFTATSSNGGTTPVYDWFINGVSQATNANTFASSTLSDGDIVTASLISNAPCATPSSVNSNAITVTVSNNVTPTVSIAASNTTVCAGSSVTYTASQTYGGTNPTYQWFVNGGAVGSNSASFTSTSIADGDAITLLMTSNESCVTTSTANSNMINMTVNPIVTPIAFISTPNNVFCPGQNVSISGTVTNGGAGVQYDWYLNGVSTGITTPTYSSSSFNDGDVVMLVATSTANCASPTVVTSNSISLVSNITAVASLQITSLSGTVCEGESITFLATGNNIGTALNYQWTINGSNVGSNNSVYASTPLFAGDIIEVTLDYEDACLNTNSVTSNQLIVNPTPIVNAGPDVTILEGTTVQINASSSISGVYSWSPSFNLDDPTILNPLASPDQTTEYMIIATSSNGCSSSDNIIITIESTDLEIFTSFSPNQDGVNDTWVIKKASLYPDISVKIFNRWGNLVYEQNNTYIPWDGKFKGADLPSETYFYIVILNDSIEALKGPVTIVR